MANVSEDVPDLQEANVQGDDSPTKKHKNKSEASTVSEKKIKQNKDHDASKDKNERVAGRVSSSDAVGTSGKSYEILRTLLTSPHKPIEPIVKVTPPPPEPSEVSSQTEAREETPATPGRKTGKADGKKRSPNKKTRDATKK